MGTQEQINDFLNAVIDGEETAQEEFLNLIGPEFMSALANFAMSGGKQSSALAAEIREKVLNIAQDVVEDTDENEIDLSEACYG